MKKTIMYRNRKDNNAISYAVTYAGVQYDVHNCIENSKYSR